MSFLARLNVILCLATAAILLISIPAGAGRVDPADAFKGIWTEDLPNQSQISKERLDLIIRYVSEGKPARQQQLRKLYESDRGKFWNEVREFFRANPPEGQGPTNGQGRTPRWRDELQKQHEEFLTWLTEAYPEKAAELAQLREKNADEYFRRFGGLYRKYGNVVAAQKKDPELAAVLKQDLDLIDERDALLRRIRQADEKDKKQLTDELYKVISKRFDLIVRKKQLQYEDLRRRLERLQRDLEKKQQDLGKLIESKEDVTRHHMDELLNPRPQVDWR